MPDYAIAMDSDSHVGSKRITTTETEQQEESLLQLPSFLSETTAGRRDSTFQDRQEETAMDHSSGKKKAMCFSLLSGGNQEMGLHPITQKNVSLFGSLEKEEVDDMGTKEGSFGFQEVGSQLNSIEADNKEHTGSCLGVEEKRVIKGKYLEPEIALEAEKKRLLSELEVGNIFGLATNSSKIDDVNNVGNVKGLDLPVKGSLKIEVIDDTALIGSFHLSGTEKDEKKGEHEIDCRKTKRSGRMGKNVKKVLVGSGTVGHMESTKIYEVQNHKTESRSQNKIMYSRKELEALRFAKVGDQRNLWRDVYNSLGKDVIRGYEDLGSWKHQKKISSGSMSHGLGRKAESPAITSVIAGKGTRNDLNIFVH
ncbi:hypothetical protein V6N13_133494 [Hibiscus sabdariffa]|uniref:Uncharacterized protein n=1 Tax=Hibiscus sabdariffa TaxID=183260 RepID=A0ABR2CJI7_9ROSI